MSGSQQAFSHAAIITANRFLRLSDVRLKSLLDAASALVLHNGSTELIDRFHRLFFVLDMDIDQAVRLWTEQGASLGALQSAAGALLIVSGLPYMQDFYRRRSIPDEVLQDSLRDMNIWMDDCLEKTGRTGLEEVGWLLRSLRGQVIRLGRLQYVWQPLAWNLAVAMRNADGLAVAFFPKPELIREDGQIEGTNGIRSTHPASTCYVADGHVFQGTPIHPGGYAERRTLRLPSDEWSVGIEPGAGSLDIHIPKDGKMELAQCGESLRMAFGFFTRHFPERPIKLFTLCTWFLDAQLQRLLPPGSNIVRFQREFYLFPVLSDEQPTYERVFGCASVDMGNAPEDSALRRAIKRFVLGGGRMRYNAGFILPGDLEAFGTGRYQTISGEYIALQLGEGESHGGC